MALARGAILQVLGHHLGLAPWATQQALHLAGASAKSLSAPLQASLSTQAPAEKEQQAAASGQRSAGTHEEQPSSSTSGGSSQTDAEGSSSNSGSSSSSSSSSGSASSSGADPRVQDMTERMFKTFRSGYQNVRSKVEGAAKGGAEGGRDRRLLQEAAKEMQAVFRAGDHIRSATRMYTGPVAAAPEGEGAEGPSELVLTKQRPSTWQKVHEKLSGLPFFGKLGGVKDTAAFKKTRDIYEDMRERYETTDHPAVHKIDDIKDRLVSGSESSRAMREIRTRDPGFDMNNFVRSVKLDAPVVSKAFLNHDLATLKLHCGPELLERFSGIFKHFTEQGLHEDPTILFVGDVEVVEVKLLDDDPFAIVQFHCQQLKCTRDKFGNVIEGATDSIQRVYYFWGLQQEKQGVVTADGQVLPPRWVIKDMMWQSMLALV